MALNFELTFVQYSSLILALLTVFIVVLIVRSRLDGQSLESKFPLPPGPKGFPIIGNLRQVPAQRSDLQFAKWATEYSKLSNQLDSHERKISSDTL